MAAKSFKTEAGTELPLLSLRGKPYLQVAHRLVWLTEKYANYKINTQFISCDDQHAVIRTEVSLLNDEGNIIRSASATKKETKGDFPDFIEKAETGSLGRALAMLGLGTQFCTQDLDEGNRLADSPIPPQKKKTGGGGFNVKKKDTETPDTTGGDADGWT
jgi:hypothetical protein